MKSLLKTWPKGVFVQVLSSDDLGTNGHSGPIGDHSDMPHDCRAVCTSGKRQARSLDLNPGLGTDRDFVMAAHGLLEFPTDQPGSIKYLGSLLNP